MTEVARAPISGAYRGYALAAMTAVYTVNLVDRGLMIVLLEPIGRDLSLSDTQLGSLTGLLFGLFYSVAGVPIARAADRGDRVTIAATSLAVWSMTALSVLLVTNFVQLAIARILAAVGEAGCKPPTYSLIGDYFPAADERTRAMSIYLSGAALSNLIAFVIGGWLAERIGWRMTFAVMAIPGILIAILFKVTIKETRPRRQSGLPKDPPPSIWQVGRLLWAIPSARHVILALVLMYTLGLGLAPWYAALLIRVHHMSLSFVGLWMGLIFSIGGVCGSLLGGFAATRLFPDDEAGQLRLSALTIASASVFLLLFLWAPSATLALLALTPLVVSFSIFLGPTYSLLQRLVPDSMRATSLSVVMLAANVIGFGIGPQVVGILSDQFAPAAGSRSLVWAMSSMSIVAVWAAIHFWRASRLVGADLAGTHRNSLPARAHQS